MSAQAVAAALHDSLGMPGLAVAVVADGDLVLSAGLGWADVEGEIPVTPQSRFRVGSLSKLFTAAAAARLVQRGALDLDAPIGRYVNGLPPDKAALTARQLAGHLAGVRHYGPGEYVSQTHYARVSDSFDRFLGDSLQTRPGTAYAYSSYGYNLLGAVLEGASGEEFQALVRAEVLTPLGLSATEAEDVTRPPASLASFYIQSEEGLVTPPAMDLSDRWPSGGYLSTAPDLARFGAAIAQGDYLGAEARALLMTSQTLADGTATDVALGWRIGVDGAGRRYLHHGGATMGGRAFLLVYPEEGVSIALTSNLSWASFAEDEVLRVAAPFLE